MTIAAGVLSFGSLAIASSGKGGLVTPPYAGSLLALVGASTPVGYDSGGGWLFLDTAHDVAYFQELLPGTGAAGLKRFTVGTNGTEVLQATQSTIFGAGPAHIFVPRKGCVHPMGKIFMNVDGGNSCPWAMIDSTTLVADVVVGVSNSSLAQSTNDDGGQKRFVASFQMLPLQNASGNYVVSRGIRSAGAEREVGVFLVGNGNISVAFAQDITEEVALLGPGRGDTSTFATTFYVLGDLFNREAGNPTPVVVYQYVVDGSGVASKKQLFRIAPTNIDPTWTNFTAISTPGYDLFDDGILAFFSTLDAVAHTDYLVKFSTVTGALMWKLPVANAITTSFDLTQSRFNGTLAYFTNGTPSVVTIVDLSDGSTTTQNWNSGFSLMSPQIFDYVTASLTAGVGYTQSTGVIPTYLGAYLAGNSNVIPNQRWGRIFLGVPYPDAEPGEGVSGVQRRIAWSFVLDGHTFYVLDLGEEGTFAWDDISKHWSAFTTSSTDPQWNMAGGCMWGDRIVAGDLSSGQVWELDPNAVQDNASLDIPHLATGIVTRRSRNYMGVGALRVAASIGQIQDGAGATMSLRFSDDQGKTWSDYYTVALTEGEYSDEIAYRGLGSFAAPGRVFELSDTGGLIRIDGCDLDPEKDEGESAT